MASFSHVVLASGWTVVDNRIPDESAIVTALAWRSAREARSPVTHVKWNAAADRPVVWTKADLPELLASGSPFCRKVSAPESDSLLDELDRLAR